jgi:GTP-binding protein HflX
VDASSDSALDEAAHVDKVLADLGCEHTPQLLVLNKIDLVGAALDAPVLAGRCGRAHAGTAALSALTGEGMEGLLAAIDQSIPVDPVSRLRLRVPAGEGAILHLLHEQARVLSTSYSATSCEVEAEIPESLRRKLADYILED